MIVVSATKAELQAIANRADVEAIEARMSEIFDDVYLVKRIEQSEALIPALIEQLSSG